MGATSLNAAGLKAELNCRSKIWLYLELIVYLYALNVKA